jgi:hypothetical protein
MHNCCKRLDLRVTLVRAKAFRAAAVRNELPITRITEVSVLDP